MSRALRPLQSKLLSPVRHLHAQKTHRAHPRGLGRAALPGCPSPTTAPLPRGAELHLFSWSQQPRGQSGKLPGHSPEAPLEPGVPGSQAPPRRKGFVLCLLLSRASHRRFLEAVNIGQGPCPCTAVPWAMWGLSRGEVGLPGQVFPAQPDAESVLVSQMGGGESLNPLGPRGNNPGPQSELLSPWPRALSDHTSEELEALLCCTLPRQLRPESPGRPSGRVSGSWELGPWRVQAPSGLVRTCEGAAHADPEEG